MNIPFLIIGGLFTILGLTGGKKGATTSPDDSKKHANKEKPNEAVSETDSNRDTVQPAGGADSVETE